jgi:hypothetical protein
MKGLARYCEGVSVANVAGGGTNHLNKFVFLFVTWTVVFYLLKCGINGLLDFPMNRMILSDKPDIVIGTPARILGFVQSKVRNAGK